MSYWLRIRLFMVAASSFTVLNCCSDAPEVKKDTQSSNVIQLQDQVGNRPEFRVGRIRRQTIEVQHRLTGRILPDVNKEIRVSPRFSGRVVSILAPLGTYVHKGDRLAMIDSTEVGSLQAEYIESMARLTIAIANEEREKSIFEENIQRPKSLIEARSRLDRAKIELEHAKVSLDRIKQLHREKIVAEKDLVSAQASFDNLTLVAREAESALKREEGLFENKGLLKRDYQIAQAETARARHHLETLRQRLLFYGMTATIIDDLATNCRITPVIPLLSPADGSISKQEVSTGEMVNSDHDLFTIMDLSKVVVAVDVPEIDVSKISQGKQLKVKVASYPTKEFSGEVYYIGDRVEPKTRSVSIRALLENPEGLLKANMFVQVMIQTTRKNILACPLDAIHKPKGIPVAYVVSGKQVFERKLTLGKEFGSFVEILDGLSEDDEVVTQGSLLLKSESAYEN